MSGRKDVEDLEFVEGALGAVFPTVSHFQDECGNQSNKMMEEIQYGCKRDGGGLDRVSSHQGRPAGTVPAEAVPVRTPGQAEML